MSFRKRLEELQNNAHAKQARAAREENLKLQTELDAVKIQHQALQAEHKATKSMLGVHEKREKRRADGLKKAQQARKKPKKK